MGALADALVATIVGALGDPHEGTYHPEGARYPYNRRRIYARLHSLRGQLTRARNEASAPVLACNSGRDFHHHISPLDRCGEGLRHIRTRHPAQRRVRSVVPVCRAVLDPDLVPPHP